MKFKKLALLTIFITTFAMISLTGQVVFGADPVIAEGDETTVIMSEDSSPTAFSLYLTATDDDGDTLTWSISSPATNGTAIAEGTTSSGESKSISYTPDTDYNGTDIFEVQVSDGSTTDSITVNVTIEPVNDAPEIDEGEEVSVTMDEDGLPTAFDLTLHATDVDTTEDNLTWSISTQAEHGTASASGTGASKVIEYTPNTNYNGTDSFVVQVSDGSLTDTITVNVTIDPVNDDPVAEDDLESTGEDTPVDIDVLFNDTDPDGDDLSVESVTDPPNGSVVNNGNNVTYTPDLNFNGEDSFTYTVSDGNGGTDSATVTVTVGVENDDPVAEDDLAGTDEDTAVIIDVLYNDTDPDEDDLSVFSVTDPPNGSVVNNGNNVTYTPDLNFNGEDSFSYTVSDGYGGTDSATVTVIVDPVNDTPVADAGEDQSVGGGITVTLDGSGSSDPDGDDITYLWEQTDSNGYPVTLSDETAAKPTFTSPDVGFGGAELEFKLTVSDGELEDWDICTVCVNCIPPTADAGANQTVTEVTTVTLNGSGSYDADGIIASYLWEQTNLSGPFVVLSSETAVRPTFTSPNVLQGGAVLTFQLTVTDNVNQQSTDTCTVTVTGDNDPPNADAGIDQTAGQGATVNLHGSNSSDPDFGDGIASYLWKQTEGDFSVTFSSATDANPTFKVPDVVQGNVSLTFVLTVTDTGGLQDTDSCVVNVTGSNEQTDSGSDTGGGTGSCFIATSAYGSLMEPHMKLLSNFHHRFLLGNPIGLTSVWASLIILNAGSLAGLLLTALICLGLSGHVCLRIRLKKKEIKPPS